MSRPATRLLELLELLQDRQSATGPEIAERLGVDLRTVRRYVTKLEELGIPVEATRGRSGGYRLRPGFKLPPLMLTEDEASAVVLGLLAARRSGLMTGGGSGAGGGPAGAGGSGAGGGSGGSGGGGESAREGGVEPAVDSALGKLRRVLPVELRERVRALEATLGFTRAEAAAPAPPQTATVLALADAIGRARRVEVGYATREGARSTRQLDPYGLVFHNGRWYLSAHDDARGELRALRLDRVEAVRVLRRAAPKPEGFDPVEHVTRTLARVPWRWEVEVLVDAPLPELRRWLPPEAVELEQREDGVLLRARAERLDGMARLLAGLGAPLTVLQPPELRDELRVLAERLLVSAAAAPPVTPRP